TPKHIRRKKEYQQKQQIRHQQPYRNQRLQVSRNAQSSKQESHAETISYVVYIKSVARTLAISIARQRPVKTVAEPVNRQKNARKQQSIMTVACQRIGATCQEHPSATQA